MRTEGPWTPVGSVVSSGQPALGGAIIKAYPHHLGLSACFITASFITASFNNTFLGRSIARRPAQAGDMQCTPVYTGRHAVQTPGLFVASAVNEEDSERDRATQA